MFTTIPYPSFSSSAAAALAFEPERRGGLAGNRIFGGLSPSDVPTSFDVELRDGNNATIWLGYANEEPGEAELRAAKADGSTQLRLGLYSRKVLEVHLSNAKRAFEQPREIIEPERISDWISGLPLRSSKSSIRSVLLVLVLLEQMPQQMRRDIRRALDLTTG